MCSQTCKSTREIKTSTLLYLYKKLMGGGDGINRKLKRTSEIQFMSSTQQNY